jgi:hypothetical protein
VVATVFLALMLIGAVALWYEVFRSGSPASTASTTTSASGTAPTTTGHAPSTTVSGHPASTTASGHVSTTAAHTPTTKTVLVTLPMGRPQTVADPAATGIVQVTVYALQNPVASGPAPPTGSTLAAADIQVCAGTSGAPQGPQLAYVELVSTTGATLQSTPVTSATPNLASTTAMAASQCVRGFLTFTVPKSFVARDVRYAPDPFHQYLWKVPG